MNQPLKTQPKTHNPIQRRCSHRANRVTWCNILRKYCDSPKEYGLCSTYQPKPTKTQRNSPAKNKQTLIQAAASHTLLIGTKNGQCDICKVTKKILLLRYGFCLCEDCLKVCTNILEQLEVDLTSKKAPSLAEKANERGNRQ